MNLSRIAVVAGTVLGLFAGALVAAAPAAAGVANLIVVTGTTGSDSSSPKSISVMCPFGKVALSGGALVEGSNAAVNVHIDQLYPYQITAGFFQASASERAAGFLGNWRLGVSAVCGDRPAGYEIKSSRSTADSNFLHTAIAECTPGKKLIGFGGRASISFGRRVALTAIVPAANLSRVVVQGHEEEGGESSVWRTEAIAVCANPIAGMVVIPESSALDSSHSKSVGTKNHCGDELQLHGFGFGIFNGQGQAWPILISTPESLTSGFAVAIEDATGYSSPWHINGHALCG